MNRGSVQAAIALLIFGRSALGTDPGTVLVLYEAPTPLQFTVAAGTPYKFNFSDTRVRLWRSQQGISGTEITAGTVLTGGQSVFGDANADGQVNLIDLITIRNDRGTSAAGSDLDASGYVDDNDLVLCRNALGAGGNTLAVYVQGLSVSSALGDVTLQLLTDPNQNGTFAVAATVTLTVVAIQISPDYGQIGSVVTLTVTPAIAPLAFDSATTATWAGELYPDPEYAFPLIPPTEHIVTSFSAAQLHEQSANQAQFVVGDGTKTSGRIGDSYLYGYIFGQATIHFGSIDVSRTFQFYTDTLYGFAAAGGGGVGDPVEFLRILDPYNPGWGSLTLEECYASHYVVAILAERNPSSEPLAPAMLPAQVVTFDSQGNEVDRVTVWMIESGRDDFGPDYFVYYSDWQSPIVFVDSDVPQEQHPTLTVVRAAPDGWVDIRIR